MTKEIRRLSIIMLFMFLALFAATSWIQVIESDALAQNDKNRRTLLDSYEIQRGNIIVGGAPIATSVPSEDTYAFQRQYSDPAMWAPVTGYYNPAFQSSTGIEAAMNADLSGTGSNAFFATLDRIVSGKPQSGFSVELSLHAAAQRAAYEGMAERGYKGAVVAIEPATGRILAMVSTPSYDPNSVASHDSNAAQAAFSALEDDPANPLYNRAIAGTLYPPGSTFKVLMGATAYETGKWSPDSTLPNPARYTLPESSNTVANAWRGTCGGGENVTIAEAIRLSCNIPMAELAVELGDKTIRESAQKFGFNHSFEVPLKVTESIYPAGLDDAQTALSGFGQGQVTATPLQIALMSAGIANDGVVMEPRMVDRVIAADLSVVRSYDNTVFDRAVSAKVANDVTESMVAGVVDGAATGATIEGVDVAGKTGTAENTGDEPYTLWFTGFAPAENPKVAVAVVVEDGAGEGQEGSGNTSAAPVAKKVIEAVLGR